MEEGTKYYYINGRISTCRRCKRKRTMDEDPQHLQFKTCFRCRMIERDQKKFNQAKRKLNQEAYEGHRSNPPTRQEIEQYAEMLKTNSRSYNVAGKQFVPTATSHPTPAGTTAPGAQANATSEFQQYIPRQSLMSTLQFTENDSTVLNNNSTNGFGSGLDPTLALLENADLHLDDDTLEIDLAYNEKLFSFNILSIDPKLNPLTLPAEQQSLLQLSFLAKYHHDQTANFPISPHTLAPTDPNLCLSCTRSNLSPDRLGKQICDSCEKKQSTMRDFNQYLTVLKLNKTQDLYRVIFITKILVVELLKSALSDDKSKDNILQLLYEKYVIPINEITGAEFILPAADDTTRSEEGESIAAPIPQITGYDTENIIKKSLKCASDHSVSSFTEASIDPEAINLKSDGNSVQTIDCKFSQLCLSYDTKTGDLVISFSHSFHR